MVKHNAIIMHNTENMNLSLDVAVCIKAKNGLMGNAVLGLCDGMKDGYSVGGEDGIDEGDVVGCRDG